MRVFVLNQRKEPLMPCKPRKARVLLKQGKAKVIKRTPFTIQLTSATGETKQAISLGVDAGYKHIGLSATTEKESLLEAEAAIRNDIVKLLSDRRELRRAEDIVKPVTARPGLLTAVEPTAGWPPRCVTK